MSRTMILENFTLVDVYRSSDDDSAILQFDSNSETNEKMFISVKDFGDFVDHVNFVYKEKEDTVK